MNVEIERDIYNLKNDITNIKKEINTIYSILENIDISPVKIIRPDGCPARFRVVNENVKIPNTFELENSNKFLQQKVDAYEKAFSDIFKVAELAVSPVDLKVHGGA